MEASTRGRYALRASLALAKIGKDGPVSISALAEYEDIPSVLLEQIFFKLKKAGIVSSIRGPEGGVFFVRPLDKLTLKELLDAVEENLDLANYDRQETEPPSRVGERLSRVVWAELTDIINRRLGDITLADVLEKEKPGGN
jgi:Rrf2 family iron-sulfur cluster assembly transcriptional regulator